MVGRRSDWDHSRTWYHGSPCQLATLREGSTITRDRQLAEAFSHRPTVVSVSDAGEIKHNGMMPGFLYAIAEQVQPDDVVRHPRSAMAFGKEWITRRELCIVSVGPTLVEPDERLLEEELEALLQRSKAGQE